jgi:hypothetical protein
MILKELMKALTKDGEEEPAPSEIFDMICGSSTGALPAILLGRLGFTCDDAMSSYERLEPALKSWDILKDDDLSSLEGFEQELKTLLRWRVKSEDELVQPCGGDLMGACEEDSGKELAQAKLTDVGTTPFPIV